MEIYSDETRRKYLRILEVIKQKNAFSHKDISEALEVSERTLTSFFYGEIIRLDLLEQILGMNGFSFEIITNLEL